MENLSPFLFAIYFNDLEDFLYSNKLKGLSFISTKLESELNVYLKLFVLLYADYTILFFFYSHYQKRLKIYNNNSLFLRITVTIGVTVFCEGHTQKSHTIYIKR